MYLECMVLCTYIGTARLRAFPMYYCSGFSRRYIGIENSMPIPMYVGSNLSTIYIGMGQYRSFPMYRQKLPKQNTSEFQVFIQSRCISINFPRVHIHPLATYSRANQPHFNFPRIYLHPLVAYPRASRTKQTKYIGIQRFMAFPMYRQKLPKQNTSKPINS